jgi:hypothetical protein
MGNTDFFSFLDKMENETHPKKQKKPIVESQPKPKPKPQPKVEEPKREHVSENLREEFIEKGLDYASAFMKSIRKNFDNKEQRHIILESVRNAINLYLKDSPVFSTAPIQESRPKPIQQISEKDWNRMNGNELQGMIHDVSATGPTSPPNPVITPTRPLNEDYNRKINLDIKLNANGQPEVDLSNMTEKDVYDIKKLAGIL